MKTTLSIVKREKRFIKGTSTTLNYQLFFLVQAFVSVMFGQSAFRSSLRTHGFPPVCRCALISSRQTSHAIHQGFSCLHISQLILSPSCWWTEWPEGANTRSPTDGTGLKWSFREMSSIAFCFFIRNCLNRPLNLHLIWHKIELLSGGVHEQHSAT